MASSTTKPTPVEYPKVSESDAYKRYFQDIHKVVGDVQQAQESGTAQEVINQMFVQGGNICNQYIQDLVKDFANANRPRLPFIPHMDPTLYSRSQENLINILTAKNGEQPKDIGLLPQDSLLEALNEAGRQAAFVPPCLEVRYKSGEESEWRPFYDRGPWYYSFKCGPRLCRWRDGETCPHGIVTMKGVAPEGWNPGTGWANGNVFQGAYTGDPESPPQDPADDMEIDSMDIDS